MYRLYRALTYASKPFLKILLNQRVKKGKEDPARYLEKTAQISRERPSGTIMWLHAASVGEVQSALILVQKLLKKFPDHNILITTGTRTSAQLIEQKITTSRVTHQFAPLDHPDWVCKFLNHWKPDMALWIESELWPNILHEIKKRDIKAVLINARMSESSYNNWKKALPIARVCLDAFNNILCQTEDDQKKYKALGANNTAVTNNLKYSAEPLPVNEQNLADIRDSCANRKIWVYASTHDAEEAIACEVHQKLQSKYPDMLTIIVPRHPERRNEIAKICSKIKTVFRGEEKRLPHKTDQIYVVDTLGELGLVYKLSNIVCIGRTFSNDGGGGHNPIEPAHYGCAVLHGPNVQNLVEVFDQMKSEKACLPVQTTEQLYKKIEGLLANEAECKIMQKNAKAFANKRTSVIETIMAHIEPSLKSL